MSLLSSKALLLEWSGRYDLTAEDQTWYLNRACRSLDSKTRHHWSEARQIGRLKSGDSRLAISSLRALKRVWLHGDSGSIECDLSKDLSGIRYLQGISNIQSEVQELLSIESPLPVAVAKVYCSETTDRSASTWSDTTVVARVNLTTPTGLTVAASPAAPTELTVTIEDGLLLPQSPHLQISAGTVTIVGTDLDGSALTEVVDCSAGAGFFKTAGVFKTVTSVTTADFNRLVTGDEKITVKTGRRSYLEDLDLSEDFLQKTLIFYPTIDEAVTVEVFGDFWSKTLSAATDKNFWTERYSDVLVMQAMLILEKPMRNRAGHRDFEEAIADVLLEINKDAIWERESKHRPTLRG